MISGDLRTEILSETGSSRGHFAAVPTRILLFRPANHTLAKLQFINKNSVNAALTWITEVTKQTVEKCGKEVLQKSSNRAKHEIISKTKSSVTTYMRILPDAISK